MRLEKARGPSAAARGGERGTKIKLAFSRFNNYKKIFNLLVKNAFLG